MTKTFLENEAQEYQRWQDTLEALNSANQGRVINLRLPGQLAPDNPLR